MVNTKCIHCGYAVHEFTPECPQCGKPVANKDAPTDLGKDPWQFKTNYRKKMSPFLVIAIITVVIGIIGAIAFFVLNKP